MRSGLVATDVGCRSKSTFALSLGALAALGNGQKSESPCGKARGGGGLRPLTGNRCPLYPQKRTWFSTIVMSALCQKRTLVTSFEHFIGAAEVARHAGRMASRMCRGVISANCRKGGPARRNNQCAPSRRNRCTSAATSSPRLHGHPPVVEQTE